MGHSTTILRSRRLSILWLSLFAPVSFGVTTNGSGVTTEAAQYVRAPSALNRMRVDPKGRFLAYIDDNGLGLNVLDLKHHGVYRVSAAQVGSAFFWSPDGFRLFFREQATDGKGAVQSTLKAFDSLLGRSIAIETLPYATGILTFDPRDLRLHLLSPKGIRTKRIYFPDERLARWQVAQRREAGKFLATQAGMLWVTQGGYAMRRLDDDGGELESFEVSPDGSTMAWATAAGRVYVCKDGQRPTFIGYGRDPSWHPDKPWLVYAGARMVGDRAVNYDIRIADPRDGSGRFVTTTQWSSERWPHWHPHSGQILYTIDHSTDAYVMDFKL